jgi:glutathione reductase (NADPH)
LIYETNWSRQGIDLVHGMASFVYSRTNAAEDNEQGGRRFFTAPKILIATGGCPSKPDTLCAEHGITSDGFFVIEELPK